MDRPTFSESWSRVSRLTPVLRPQVQVRRRTFGGQPWHVLHDPISNDYFRLNPVLFHFVGLLDGRRSVDEVWRLVLERFGDDAPTQAEVIGLLGQLNQSNLLRVDLPADAEPLLRRRQERRMRYWAGQAMSVLFIQIPLVNPDRLLERLLPIFRPLLSAAGLVLWAVWLVVTGALFFPHLREFVGDTQSMLSEQAATNWGWMLLAFLGVKLVHELGHGLVCKRLGGPVHEAGIMMLVLLPSPYVDATSAWGFEDRWKRVLVGAAGMMVELAIAGGAALVWLHTDAGALSHQIAHRVVLLASVATLLFNANPLMRFDGYFVLSDLLEIPNLYDRANQQLRWLAQRYAFGLSQAQPPASQLGEQVLLTIYAIAAGIYRVVIMLGIILFIAGWFFTIGLALALWTAAAWLVIPAVKFIYWLVTHPGLYRHRARALAVSALAAAAAIGLLGMYPAADHRRLPGVVEAGERAELAAQTDGQVTQVLVQAGQTVEAGQVILVADNSELRSRRRELAAEMTGLNARRDQALAEKPAEVSAAEARLQAAQEKLTEIDQELAGLVLKSPRKGRLIASAMGQLEGQFLKRGTVIGRVDDLDTLRVTALADQAQNSLAFFGQVEQVELRAVGQLGRVIPSRLMRVFPSGRTQLPHPALSYAGGGAIATDPEDRDGRTSLRPQFELWLSLPAPPPDAPASAEPSLYPGQRVHVRLTPVQRRPLLAQWLHSFRQMFRERFTV